MSKSYMPLAYAKTFLAASVVDILDDKAFGDMEITWLRNGRNVATGYFGKSAGVVIHETKQFAVTEFEDGAANQLQGLGKRGEYQRNDAGDPRKRS